MFFILQLKRIELAKIIKIQILQKEYEMFAALSHCKCIELICQSIGMRHHRILINYIFIKYMWSILKTICLCEGFKVDFIFQKRIPYTHRRMLSANIEYVYPYTHSAVYVYIRLWLCDDASTRNWTCVRNKCVRDHIRARSYINVKNKNDNKKKNNTQNIYNKIDSINSISE